MSSDSDGDRSFEELRERVAELESKVPDGPTRRQVVAGGGLLGLGGLLGGGATQQATAQTAVGQVGTSSEPVDVEAASVNAGSVNADEATFGADPERPLISNGHQTVNVPGDYGTIQEAINNCPVFLRHEYVINVDDGDYSTEDLLIPQTVATGPAADGYTEQMFFLGGNSTTPSNVKIGSIHVSGAYGKTTPLIEGFEVTNNSPYSEDPSPVVVYGSRGPAIRSIVSNYTHNVGAYIYESDVELRNCDWGTVDFNGVVSKRNSNVVATDLTGTSGSNAYTTKEGSTISVRGTTVSGEFTPESGAIFDKTNGDFFYTTLHSQGLTGKPKNLSGRTGNASGEMRMDNGTNTTHGDPDMCIWMGTEWRQVGTTNTFS